MRAGPALASRRRGRTFTLGVLAALASVLPALASTPAPAAAEQPGFNPVPFAPAKTMRLTQPVQMTKDQPAPVRAFTGPTSMLADPGNPRVVVAATADLRTRVCQLVVSRDAGRTWHFSKQLPGLDGYPYCMDNSAGLAAAAIAWGRNHTLYYTAEAFGPGEGGFSVGHVSQVLAKTTDLGNHWTRTLVENNRGKPEPAPADYGASIAVDTSGKTDVVYVGYNQHYPTAPMDSPLNNGPVVVAVSTDAGKTFAPAVDLSSFTHLTQNIGGKDYPLLFEGNFGAPLLLAHDGVVLAVSGSQNPFNNQPGQDNFDASFNFAMPQLVARSTDNGKTWTAATLGPPVFNASGSQTGMVWTPKGGADGTYVVAYQATPAAAQSSGPAQIVVQRSRDGGRTWSPPVAVDDDDPANLSTSFYPQLNVAPNGRIDAVWQDDRDVSDFHFNVRYAYSDNGGVTWSRNMLVTDQPIDFNRGVSFNSDLRQPPGVASTNQYALIGWADTRLGNDVTQTQDDFGAAVQFSLLPSTKNTTLPWVAAVFAGLVIAGAVLLVLLVVRRSRAPAG